MIRNLLLDWSGTLADDLGGVLEGTNGVLGHYGKAPLSREEFRKVFRLPYTEFYREVLPDFVLEEVLQLYLDHFPGDPERVPLLPHAREFLEYAAATGRRMFLLSSAPEAHFEAQAKHMGVREFFEAAYCGVVDKRVAIVEILKNHGLKPEETAFIGDMRHDLEAAHAGGVLSIATATGYETAEVLLQADPELMVRNLSSLPKLLGGWGVRADGEARPQQSAPTHPVPITTVGALILNQVGEVLLLKTHKWSHRWGIPGGKIQRGETCEQALRREIREETGLELRDVQFVMVQDCVEPPEFERSAHFLLLNYLAICAEAEPQVVLNDEAEAWQWLPWEEAVRQDLNIPTRLLMEEISHRGLVKTAVQ